MRLLDRLCYANVVGTLALFFALTGTAFAGAQLLITGADVENRSLTGADIKKGSLGVATLSPTLRARLKATAGSLGQRGARGPAGTQGSQGAQGPVGPQGPAGPQGATGAQGAPGAGVSTATATGTNVTNYQDLTTLVSYPLTVTGDYVIFTTLTVHNTGANSEYLNCGYRLDGTINGAAGVDTTAGGTASGTSVGAFHAASAGTVEFICTGSGATTYDISNITMRVHHLG